MDDPPRSFDVRVPGCDHRVAERLSVFLNGIEQTAALAYDLDAGTLVRLRLDRDGKAIMDPRSRKLVEEVVTGDVEVLWRD